MWHRLTWRSVAGVDKLKGEATAIVVGNGRVEMAGWRVNFGADCAYQVGEVVCGGEDLDAACWRALEQRVLKLPDVGVLTLIQDVLDRGEVVCIDATNHPPTTGQRRDIGRGLQQTPKLAAIGGPRSATVEGGKTTCTVQQCSIAATAEG